MKTLFAILIIFSCASCKQDSADLNLHELDHLTMSDYWRCVTGCDSITIVKNFETGAWEAQFTYPNKWERRKFQKDTVYIHDTIYTSKSYGNVQTLIIGK